MAKLVLCSDCARHFRRNESSCPFCGAAVDVQALNEPSPLARGISRAKRYALQAALLAGTATLAHAGSCGSSKQSVNNGTGANQPQPEPTHQPADDDMPAKPYGCVWPDPAFDDEPVSV